MLEAFAACFFDNVNLIVSICGPCGPSETRFSLEKYCENIKDRSPFQKVLREHFLTICSQPFNVWACVCRDASAMHMCARCVSSRAVISILIY